MTEQTQPTDAELRAWVQSLIADDDSVRNNDERDHMNFARAVLAKWGTPAGAGEPVAEVISTNGLEAEFTCEMLHGHVPALGAVVYLSTPQPTQAQAGAVPLTGNAVNPCKHSILPFGAEEPFYRCRHCGYVSMKSEEFT